MKLTKLLALVCAVLLMTVSLCACDVNDIISSLKDMLGGSGGEVVGLAPGHDIPDGETDSESNSEANRFPISIGGNIVNMPGAKAAVVITVKEGYDAEALTDADFPGLTVESIEPIDEKQVLLVTPDAGIDTVEAVKALPFVEDASLGFTVSGDSLPDDFEVNFGVTDGEIIYGE